ncbi:MAG: phosphoenolpyruvate carboxykinase (ATP) [Flavitalea sp.]
MPVIASTKTADSSLLSELSFTNRVHYQASPEQLVELALRNNEGRLNNTGALVIHTGQFTGRSPKDKFIVKDDLTADVVNWNDFNIPIGHTHFANIASRAMEHLNKQSEIYMRDCYACADPRFRLSIRVITESAAANLFAYNMFLRPSIDQLLHFSPEWTLLFAPTLKLNPQICGTRQSNAAVISFSKKMIVIAGTGYTGEIKKGVFTVLNYLLPYNKNVLSMHCSANMGKEGDTALFFGLSGTGKTTLSADPNRKLIGDDEHGWSHLNIFNFEGGCYAKTIDLSEEKEPEIFHSIREGALVENTVFYPGTNEINFSDNSFTENTRVSYPLHYISNSIDPSVGNIPSNLFFLTCDAYGVLPPISKLNPAQAMYQFISGYTAKVAGTEAGVKEPVSTFSACFGAPFMPLHPGKYAAMLGEKLHRHHVKVWLINTGWTGGGVGVGTRMNLCYTRAMIHAALEGKLDHVGFGKHPVFGMDIPVSCPGVPANLLNPKDTWSDKDAYDANASELARQFVSNFRKYAEGVNEEILAEAPLI